MPLDVRYRHGESCQRSAIFAKELINAVEAIVQNLVLSWLRNSKMIDETDTKVIT
jgi:hypothetical protein